MDIITWADSNSETPTSISRKLACTYNTAIDMYKQNRVRTIEMAERVEAMTGGQVTKQEAVWPKEEKCCQ